MTFPHRRHAATVIMLCLFFIAASVYGRTWYVKADGTGDAPTIQAAVDLALPGDTVLVGPGTYPQVTSIPIGGATRNVCVHLYKNLVLIAEGTPQETTIGGNADVVIFAEGIDSTAVIKGFTLTTQAGQFTCVGFTQPSGASIFLRMGIRCESASPVLLDNDIQGNEIAIYLLDSSPTISHNTIHQAFEGIHGINSECVMSDNIIYNCGTLCFFHASAPTIVGNDMSDACDGLYFVYGSDPFITGNHVHFLHSTSPQAVFCDSSATVEGNTFDDTGTGVMLTGGSGVPCLIRNNIFTNVSTAIEDRRGGASITNNTMQGTWVGVTAVGGTVISNNIITGFENGIICLLSASQPTVTCNDVLSTNPPADTCSLTLGQDGNFSLDPQFCGIPGSGNFYLQSDSPCAPGNHPAGSNCGLIGALPVACQTSGAEKRSWGGIKALYRGKEH